MTIVMNRIMQEQNMHQMLVDAERKAAEAILAVYGGGIARGALKADGERFSNDDFADHLARTSSYPVLTAEGKDTEYDERRRWETFWLVAPPRGREAFINGEEELTMTVALIRGCVPVMGAIYVPALDTLYTAVKGGGAYRIANGRTVRLPVHRYRPGCVVAGSHAQATPETDAYMRKLRARDRNLAFVPAGNSLAFCLVAEGEADLYPRLETTMEWDTAAGQLIVEEAGGMIVEASSNRPLRYNKVDLRNPHFIVFGRGCHG